MGIQFTDKEARVAQCDSWRRYKGIHKPRCAGGRGCEKCWEIYRKALMSPALRTLARLAVVLLLVGVAPAANAEPCVNCPKGVCASCDCGPACQNQFPDAGKMVRPGWQPATLPNGQQVLVYVAPPRHPWPQPGSLPYGVGTVGRWGLGIRQRAW